MKKLLATLAALVAGAAALLVAVPLLVVVAVSGEANTTGPDPDDVEGIPPMMLAAYKAAAEDIGDLRPQCSGVEWAVLAGVGRVESNHAAGSEIDTEGDIAPAIIGPRLDGGGVGGNTTPIFDTDGGRWDQDTEYDRAVGALQFLPGTFTTEGASTRQVDEPDPHNAFDITLTAASYLCGQEPADLSVEEELRDALFRYNRSTTYVDEVVEFIDQYRNAGGVDPGEDADPGDYDGADPPPVVDNINELRARAEAFVEASAAGRPDPFYGSSHYYRLCGRLAARVHGHANSGHVSALLQWTYYRTSGQAHEGDRNPPPGALLFWDSQPHGHVAVYLGNGLVVSNDIYDDFHGQGGVYIAPIEEFSNGRWSQPYLGWAEPIY